MYPVSSHAEHVRSFGRGEDTMLVHMTPHEVGGLQALALASGGSLTINPHTGLPEAGWLGKLLPTLLGGLSALIPGVGPLLAAGIIGVGDAAITGNIGQGLQAALGAFGGASLAGALGAGSAFGASQAAQAAAPVAQGAASVPQLLSPETTSALTAGAAQGAGTAGIPSMASLASRSSMLPLNGLSPVAAQTPGFLSRFSDAAAQGLGSSPLARSLATGLAGTGLLNTLGGITQPNLPQYDPNKSKWGPYAVVPPTPRAFTPPMNRDPNDSSEYSWFNPVNPMPGFAFGGQVNSGLPSLMGRQDGTQQGGFGFGRPMGQGAAAQWMPQQGGMQQRPSWMQGGGFPWGGQSMFGGNQPPQQAQPPILNQQPRAPLPGAQQALANWSQPPSFTPPPMAGQQLAPAPGMQAAPDQDGQQGMFGNLDTSQGLGAQTQTQAGNTGTLYTPGFAAGGAVNLPNGSFVVDARTVSELGSGSSNAGMELLARLGGIPLRGSGDGVSDSIPALIDGKQPAKVARDEVVFPPHAVAHIGGGDMKQGTQKLYALMQRAQQARAQAEPGQRTGLIQ